MTDIIERLHSEIEDFVPLESPAFQDWRDMLIEAAEEIRRLREENAELRAFKDRVEEKVKIAESLGMVRNPLDATTGATL